MDPRTIGRPHGRRHSGIRLRVARLGGALALAALLAAVASNAAHAQQAPAIAAFAIAPETAHVGDRLTLTIALDYGEQFSIEGPGFGDDFGALELIEVAPPDERSGDGAVHTELRYTLAAFAPGAVTLPPLPIAWRGPQGQGTLRTPATIIVIDSVLAPGDTELRGPKPQLDLAEDAPSPMVPGLFVAIFAALTALGYVLVRRAIDARPAPVAAASAAPPPVPPEVAARAQLDALAHAGHGDPRAYYATLAVTVRRYLSDRYGFPAYAMTRTELGRHMTAAGIDRWAGRLASNLLEQCDAVQFAGFEPAPERADADLTAAYEIIALGQGDGDGSASPI